MGSAMPRGWGKSVSRSHKTLSYSSVARPTACRPNVNLPNDVAASKGPSVYGKYLENIEVSTLL